MMGRTIDPFIVCMVLALRDGVAFLENPKFFDQIQSQRAPWSSEKHNVRKITHLPPAMMKGAQSLKTLENYVATYPGDLHNLRSSIAKYTFAPHHTLTSKQGNYYICEKSLKYHLIALLVIKTLSAEKLQQTIAKSLLIEK